MISSRLTTPLMYGRVLSFNYFPVADTGPVGYVFSDVPGRWGCIAIDANWLQNECVLSTEKIRVRILLFRGKSSFGFPDLVLLLALYDTTFWQSYIFPSFRRPDMGYYGGSLVSKNRGLSTGKKYLCSYYLFLEKIRVSP